MLDPSTVCCFYSGWTVNGQCLIGTTSNISSIHKMLLLCKGLYNSLVASPSVFGSRCRCFFSAMPGVKIKVFGPKKQQLSVVLGL